MYEGKQSVLQTMPRGHQLTWSLWKAVPSHGLSPGRSPFKRWTLPSLSFLM